MLSNSLRVGVGFIIKAVKLDVVVIESIYFCPNILTSYEVAPETEDHET